MQNAETVLGVLRGRGGRGLPCNELYRQMFNPELYLIAFFRTNFLSVLPIFMICWSDGVGDWSAAIADGRHSEVGGPGAAVSLDAPVEAGEFAFSGFQADFQALDFAEPAVHPCFGDPFAEVADDLDEAGAFLRRHAEHCASQACVLMLAS